MHAHFYPPLLRSAEVTAYALPGDRARCLEYGIDDNLAKPVSFRELEAALVRASGSRTPFP